MNEDILYKATINGTNIIARCFILDALLCAHAEAQSKGLSIGKRKGLVFANEVTCSWRSATLQAQLVAQGASKTMWSNHRAGVAIDVYADWDYINKLAPIMKKYGLVNDLAYWNKSTGNTSAIPLPGYVAWDGGHFNWKSNTHANTYRIINEQLIINSYTQSMIERQYEGLILWNVEGDGGFALIKDGKRRVISEARAGKAALALEATAPADAERKVIPVPKEVWDAIAEGEKF